jgi:hypothetical protein
VTIIDADTADRIRMAELLRRAKEQNAELQEMLSKAEDELTALRRENRLIVTISNKFYAERDVAQDRVRVLEAALRNALCLVPVGHNKIISDGYSALNPQPATGDVRAAKEHCPRRLMGEELPTHMPCDTGDHSRDASASTETPTPELLDKRLGDFSKEFDKGYTETPALAADEAAMVECEDGEICEERLETRQCDHTREIDRLKAALGRAVAALDAQCSEHAGNCCASWCKQCEKGRRLGEEVDADPTCKRAGEAWAEMVECHRLLKIVRGHGMPRRTTFDLQQECDRAIAAVDARKAGW